MKQNHFYNFIMEEEKLKDLMQHSKLEIQFPDFEESVMEQIKLKEKTRKLVWRNLKISWIFFFIGAFLGVFGSYFFNDLKIEFLGESSNLILLASEIFIVVIITIQLDNLIRFTFKKRD